MSLHVYVSCVCVCVCVQVCVFVVCLCVSLQACLLLVDWCVVHVSLFDIISCYAFIRSKLRNTLEQSLKVCCHFCPQCCCLTELLSEELAFELHDCGGDVCSAVSTAMCTLHRALLWLHADRAVQAAAQLHATSCILF